MLNEEIWFNSLRILISSYDFATSSSDRRDKAVSLIPLSSFIHQLFLPLSTSLFVHPLSSFTSPFIFVRLNDADKEKQYSLNLLSTSY